MKRLLVAVITLVLSVLSLSAEKLHEVTLRSGRQDQLIRIVLESDEDLIRGANTVASPAGIRIEFPAPYEMKKPDDFPFEVSRKDRFLMITLKDVGDVRVYKLAGPSRLVLDLKPIERPPVEGPQAQTQKQQKDVPPTDQRTGPGAPPGQKPTEPPLSAEKGRVWTYLIDPGHGGYDHGITDQGAGLKEKDINLSLANELSAALAKQSQKALMTRKSDLAVSLNDRINAAGTRKPNLFISLHASGTETFALYTSFLDDQGTDASIKLYSLAVRQARHIEKSRELAKALAESLRNEFKTEVIIRELPLPLLNGMNAPAVLIEYPSMKLYASDKKTRERFMNALITGTGLHE